MVTQSTSRSRDLGLTLVQWSIVGNLLSSTYVRVEPALTDILALFLIVLWVILPMPHKPLLLPLMVINFGVAFFGFLPFLFSNWRGDLEYGLQFGLITVYLTVYCCVLAQIFAAYGRVVLHWVLLGFFGASLVSLVPSLLTYMKVLEFPGVIHTGGQLKGFFKDPNAFGPILVIAFGFALYMILNTQGYVRVWLVLLALLEFVGILLNFSRGAWLNLLVVLVMLGVFRIVSLRRQMGFYLAGLLILIIVLPLAMQGRIGVGLANELGLSSWGEGQVGINEDVRFDNQAKAFQIAQDSLLGFGAGQAQVLLPLSTHNLYLQVLLEQGWMGLLFLAGLIVLTLTRLLVKIKKAGQHRTFYVMLMALIMGILANSLVIDTLHWRYFWVLLALAWGEYE